jgi:hypothetical protein
LIGVSDRRRTVRDRVKGVQKTAAWLVIGTFVLAIASPIIFVIGELAYEELDWSYWLSGSTPSFLVTCAAILLLEGVRAIVPRFYAALWPWVAVVIVPWGLYGLVWYLPNALRWHDFIFFLPGLALAAGVAYARRHLTGRQFALLLTATAVLLYVNIVVSHNNTREICRWLRGDGVVIPNGGGGCGGPAGGMTAALSSVNFDDLEWLIYGAPGVLLMTAMLAVRPRRNSRQFEGIQ